MSQVGIIADAEQFSAWTESVNDNLSALICIVTQMAQLDEQAYTAIVLRCRAMKDQVHAQMRDEAEHAPPPSDEGCER